LRKIVVIFKAVPCKSRPPAAPEVDATRQAAGKTFGRIGRAMPYLVLFIPADDEAPLSP
jgi:hypothetical protein